MPKSHFPSRGGPYSPAFSAKPFAQAPSQEREKEPAKPLRPELQGLTTQALEAEVQRLRQELTRAQNTPGSENLSQGSLPHMVWVAIAVSSVGLLFAVIAILNHG